MPTASPIALTIVRVSRGAERPADSAFAEALARDRARLHGDESPPDEMAVTGPFPVEIDGQAYDEYVVWER